MLRQLEQNDNFEVVYLKFDQNMMKVTGDTLLQSPIKKYFFNLTGQQRKESHRQPMFRSQIGRSVNMKSVRSSGVLSLLASQNEFRNLANLNANASRKSTKDQQRNRTGSQAILTDDDKSLKNDKNYHFGRERSYSLLGIMMDRTSIESSD